jgi:hypothetical protein
MSRFLLYALLVAVPPFATSQAPSAWQAPSVSPAPTPQIIPPFLLPYTAWRSEADLHNQFLIRFKAAVGLGAARMVDLEAPLSSRLTLRVMNSEDPSADPVTLHYSVSDPELIGIATRPAPVAFSVRSHQSKATQTRPLTPSEQRALTTLRAGSNVTGENTTTGRLVVGAIRATNECLACHATFKTGELLGALSYRLTLVSR